MSARKRFSKIDCVYCGNISNDKDHIPPKNLFAERKELITVPSCNTCNQGFSKDDEYFRLVLTINENVETNEEAQNVLNKVHRSFAKPKKQGFVNSIAKNTKIVPRYSASGLFLGYAPTFEFSQVRLNNVARRIAIGLYFLEKGNRLSSDCKVESFMTFNFANDVSEYTKPYRDLLSIAYHNGQSKVVGNKVFRYWFSFMEEFDEPYDEKSVWLFRFYEKIDFLCVTSRKIDEK
jgi:hypothetical protein